MATSLSLEAIAASWVAAGARVAALPWARLSRPARRATAVADRIALPEPDSRPRRDRLASPGTMILDTVASTGLDLARSRAWTFRPGRVSALRGPGARGCGLAEL